jgi:alkanesulfonate monooxygenase SsuD/methylene tetrahydromethanopterin reductase-like flavin-dependent oxidoreductase (luciferase family)
MWSDDDGPYQGRHYQLDATLCSPSPVSVPHPRILIGGSGERKTLRLVAQHADACNVFGDAATLRHKFEVLERHCQQVGRDPSEITKTAFVLSQTDPDEARDLLRSYTEIGVDGVVVMGTHDPARIEELGRTLNEYFP